MDLPRPSSVVDRVRTRIPGLTTRERDVLALVGRGLSNAETARNLTVTEGTVETHVSAILQRPTLGNQVQAAILA
jgi:DNA-binding NarL/FixJ family response regulator